MHLFYTPDITSDTYTLNEEESNHCNKVLRLKQGDTVHLIDGVGGLYVAQISETTKKAVRLNIIDKQQGFGKRNHYLHIAIAPTKNIDRIEWFLEKATEIGIDEITPIICDRSERKIVKEERLEKVVTSAVKQSLTAYHPKINTAIAYKDFIKQSDAEVKMIAHCIDENSKQAISELIKPHQKYLILIGPEGDFTPKEIELALQNGYKPVTLGNTRLRTETAGLAACFEVNFLNRE
ncbi:16S rRNA (uracil(1498)-N(3))-methyltransferase [Pedobacter chitinilyticus]|uniref:Ribosomal RNA small subunit methyltransferase E n=1 Tax=Pedobacter chitinilyticus TaxID=2233776 RepID=A0A443YR03_9SPHI|nr:16S rRNA (uracil(1498)-N(3))-methyltransferase [Pedobacter chitinilyticus]RWU06186.1 16S rRNA (uracil(1498)-N(3))-methyltransferase [Pedobacter chitinilyticus]